jgi:predicted NodU family carbamoyl transferase
MIVLGISGFFNLADRPSYRTVSPHFYHDAAAALIIDGEVVAAAEQERFDRIKHSNNFPLDAISSCLDVAQTRYTEIDRVAFFFAEDHTDRTLLSLHVTEGEKKFKFARDFILEALDSRFGSKLASEVITFVKHHDAHAACAHFDRNAVGNALVCVVDGAGEKDSISLYIGTPDRLTLLKQYARELSIGHFYGFMTDYLGFGDFAEYKVMGLAAYGNPQVYRSAVQRGYELLPEGGFSIEPEEIARQLALSGAGPRRPGDAVSTADANVAAAVQEITENVMLHILKYAQRETGTRSLCLAGGVGQNSSMNGLIARSGLFEEVYVHYAPHDSGAALGAALLVGRQNTIRRSASKKKATRTLAAKNGSPIAPFLGPSVVTGKEVRDDLARWSGMIEYQELADLREQVAIPITRGSLVGIARGRAEFGPRALGNRSIVADPRQAESRELVNSLVKGRERFRPLAPAVLSEAASDFFLLPSCKASLEYMGIVVPVRNEAQNVLEAVTHVDGTARVQLVDRNKLPWFYSLIEECGSITDVPIVLNTSFNNHSEPIVQTAHDALQCYLTSILDILVIDELVITKKRNLEELDCSFAVEVRKDVGIFEHRDARKEWAYFLDAGRRGRVGISRELAVMLTTAKMSVISPLSSGNLMHEIIDLWREHFVTVRPSE